jgi:hypothetical protein
MSIDYVHNLFFSSPYVLHRLDTGHFAVEDCLDEIASGIHRFYPEKVKKITSDTQFLMP